MLIYKTETRPGVVAFTTSGQETERVHSYNPGARTGLQVCGTVSDAAAGKMRRCGYADVATGKMRRKMWINICILPAHAPSVTGILKSTTFHGVIC